MTSSDARLPGFTYLAIMGLLTSIGALATDIMLPALGVLGQDLGGGDLRRYLDTGLAAAVLACQRLFRQQHRAACHRLCHRRRNVAFPDAVGRARLAWPARSAGH